MSIGSMLFPRTVKCTDPSVLDRFRRRRVVVISPHFDDACYSLGQFLQSIGRGELVNVFTRGNYLAYERKAHEKSSPDTVYAIRDREDAEFARRCGLTRHDLGCEEPSLRGRRPRAMQHIEDELLQMAPPFRALLEQICHASQSDERPCLFAPLGIGKHVNHRAISAFVARNLAWLSGRFDVFLYEDLPYASNPANRLVALRRASAQIGLGTRYVMPSAWPVKLSLIEIYKSQRRSSQGVRSFRPFAPNFFSPHEAFWSITPNSFEVR